MFHHLDAINQNLSFTQIKNYLERIVNDPDSR
jgi:hypothetical protein